jgi:hypothetical protein
LGGGAHYLVFKQKPLQNIDVIDYQAIASPSIWSEFRFKLYGRLGITGEYHSQSGDKITSKTLSIKETQVQWTYTTFGFDYQLGNYFRLFRHIWVPRVLLSYQMHSMPFLVKLNDGSHSITSLEFSSLSVGGLFEILSSENWHFILTNRLQVPIQSQSKVQVRDGLSFDGTIGTIYHFNKHLAWSIFWGGQYHGLKYKSDIDEGDYTLWTSKLNTLIGIYF